MDINKSLSHELRMPVTNFTKYDDGFSFTVPSEMEAYKAAYKYQSCKKVVVSVAPNINAWSVQVYS